MKKYNIKWWKDWIEADCFDKDKKLEKLPALKQLYKITQDSRFDDETKKQLFFADIGMLLIDLYEECLYQEMIKNDRPKNKKSA